ncbi:MAG TPA: hypothetical protein VIT65_22910 [Microlunatus sp.]
MSLLVVEGLGHRGDHALLEQASESVHGRRHVRGDQHDRAERRGVRTARHAPRLRTTTGEKKLLVLAGTDSAERYFDTDFFDEHTIPWYDHWLKGADNGVEQLPAVRLDVRNSRREGLREEAGWPLVRAVATPFYLDPTPAGAVHPLNDGTLFRLAHQADERHRVQLPTPRMDVVGAFLSA